MRGRSATITENTEQNQTKRQRVVDQSDSHNSNASGVTLGAMSQQIRSMLDV